MICARRGSRSLSLRTQLREESGVGLVEILVSVVILAIVLTLVTGMFVNTSRAVNISKSSNTNSKAASLGLNELSKALRFAASNPVSGQPIDDPAFVVANNDLLTVISYINVDPSNPRPTELVFTIDATRQLVETRYDSYQITSGFWGFYTTAASTRILTGALIAPTGSDPQLFTYLDSNNTALTVPGAGLTLAQRKLVASVQVSIKLKSADATSGNPVTFTSTIGIPNLGINRTGQ